MAFGTSGGEIPNYWQGKEQQSGRSIPGTTERFSPSPGPTLEADKMGELGDLWVIWKGGQNTIESQITKQSDKLQNKYRTIGRMKMKTRPWGMYPPNWNDFGTVSAP